MNRELERMRDEIKRTLTMDDVVRILGMSEIPANRKIRSLSNPGERTPSLHMYQTDWYDYSTGEGGDQIAFVQKALGVSYIQALESLARGTSRAPRRLQLPNIPFEPADYTARFEAEEDVHDFDDQWEDVVARKWPTLELRTIRAYGVKVISTGDLWIPHYHDKVVRGIKRRHLPDASKSSVTGSTFTVGLYNPVPWRRGKTHALVVEGESDTWVMTKMLWTRDVSVFGLPAGAGALKDRFIDQLAPFTTVGLALDGDEAGTNAAAWFYERLGDRAYRVEVPGGRVAEAAAEGWTL